MAVLLNYEYVLKFGSNWTTKPDTSDDGLTGVTVRSLNLTSPFTAEYGPKLPNALAPYVSPARVVPVAGDETGTQCPGDVNTGMALQVAESQKCKQQDMAISPALLGCEKHCSDGGQQQL